MRLKAKLALIILLVLACFLFPLGAWAEGIPFGVTEKKLEAVYERTTTSDQQPDGYPGSLRTQEELSRVGARTNVPIRQIYKLTFYNVGAMKGEAFADALLTIETIATGGGQVVQINPNENARAKQPTTLKAAEDLPEFKTFVYKLKFTGGYDGVFTSVSPTPEVLNIYGPRTIRLKVVESGRLVAFDIPGVSIPPLTVKPEGAFDDWVKAATGKDPVKAVPSAAPALQTPQSGTEESEGPSAVSIAAIIASIIAIIGAGVWIGTKFVGKGSEPEVTGEEQEKDSSDILLELTYPAGRSPNVFTTGWCFGARCIVTTGSQTEDISDSVQWSGSGIFEPNIGAYSRPLFQSDGANTIVLNVNHGGRIITKQYQVNAVSSEGYAAVRDISVCMSDSHGCPACPHPVRGIIQTGSGQVLVNGKPAARVGDTGVHIERCCGDNTFEITEGDSTVLINGRPAARIGDHTQHCGGRGEIRRS